MKGVLGVDWGGTYIKAGLVTDTGRILRKIVYESTRLRDKNVFIAQLTSLVRELGRNRVRRVGIGAPGIIDIKRGFIYYLPNIAGWKNYPLRDVLQKELGLPVYINNDANAFAVAETRFGAARGARRAICLTLGTGMGGAVVFGGKLLETDVSAHEIGHAPISLRGRACGCGAHGCIETFVGNKYLAGRYRALKRVYTPECDIKSIYQRALQKEAAALKVWEEFSCALGKYLGGLVNIFNPDVIVFGGGISGAFSLFKPMVLRVIRKQAMWPHCLNLKLLKAKLKDPGIIGAALLAQERHN